MRPSNSLLITSAAVISLITASGCQVPSDTSSNSQNSRLSLLGLDSSRSALDQCLSPTASIVAFSDTAVSFSGNATIKGSVVLLGGSTLRMSGNAKISDKLYVPSNNSVSTSGNAAIGQVVERDFTGNEKDVLDFVDSLAKLPETATVQQINSSATLYGNGSVNIIDVAGNISLSGNQTLTLQGGANDLFLINVAGNVSLSGNSNIIVSGGVPAANVLFRVPNSGAVVHLSGNGNVQGTFIAPRGTAQISGNGRIQGSVLAWNNITLSGNGLTFDPSPFCPVVAPSPTPTPTVTASPSPTASPSSTPSASPSVEPSASPSVEPSASPTAEPTVSPTPSDSPTVTPSVSPSVTPSTTPSATPSPSASPSASPSPDVSPSPSPTSCTGPFCGGIIGV